MMPLPLPRESAEAQEKRKAGIARVMEATGARVKNRSWFVEWVIETSAGDLIIIPRNDWITCQFQDVRAAAKVLYHDRLSRIDPRSGEWNFYYPTPQRTRAKHVRSVIKELRRYGLI